MSALAERFSANLKRERERAGLSQEALGVRASLHRTQISMLERGFRLPRIDTLVKLSGAIECEVTDLLEGIEWHAPPPNRGRFGVRES